MAENATATADNAENKGQDVKVETPELTAEQKAEIFNSLPKDFQDSLNAFNAAVAKRNADIESIKAAESKDPKLIKAEIFEQNNDEGGAKNVKLKRLLEEENKLRERIEAIRKQAYEIIDTDGLMPKDLSEAEVEALKKETQESLKELRAQSDTFTKMEDMLPMYKGKLVMHLAEIKTLRGTATRSAGGSTSTGDGPKRPRFKKIEINGVTQDDKGNTVFAMVDGEERYTFSNASAYLKKQHKGINWNTKKLQDAYYAGIDADNPPEVHEFVMPYTFKDEAGNEHTVNYTFKCYK